MDIWQLLIDIEGLSPWLDNRDLYNASCCSKGSMILLRQIQRARVAPYQVHHIMDSRVEEVVIKSWAGARTTELLERLPRLTSVAFEDGAITSANHLDIARVLRAKKDLKVLSLRRVFCGIIIRDCLANITTLTINNFINLRMPPAKTNFAMGLVEAKNLTSLNLANNGFLPPNVADLLCDLKNVTTIKRLNMSHNSFGAVGGFALAAAIRKWPHLEDLAMESTKLMNDQAAEMGASLQYTPRLRTLRLASNWLGSQGILGIAAGLRHTPQIELLDISGNSIGGDGVNQILDGLEGVPLRTLIMKKVLAIQTTLVIDTPTRLTTMVLSENWLVINRRPTWLQRTPLLQTLHLDNNGIDDYGASELARTLDCVTMLQELDIHGNGIRDVGALALIAVLERLPRMRRLDLSWNNIKEPEVVALRVTTFAVDVSKNPLGKE